MGRWTELERPAEIRSLRLVETGQGFSLTLDLQREDLSRIEVTFTEVTELRVHQQMRGLSVALKVSDHRPDGWEERSQLHVMDIERGEEQVAFYCSSIVVG